MRSLWQRRRGAHLLISWVCGVFAATGLAPLGLWPVAAIAFAIIPQILTAAPTGRMAGWIGWFFGLGYFGAALNWIVEPFLVDIARHGWMAPFGLLFMSGGLALFWAAAFWLSARMSDPAGQRIAALVVTLSMAEMARAYVFTGFPWAAPGQIWIETPFSQLLAWIGPHGLNLMTFAALMPLGLIVRAANDWRVLPAALTPALMVAGLTIATVAPSEEVSLTGKTVRLVQPNAPQHQKWDPAYVPVFFDRQIAFTGAGDAPDLIVWPEASLPGYIATDDDPLGTLARAARGADVIVGMLRPAEKGFYNSLAHIDGDGGLSAVYDKHHLVPFGEYLPFEDFLNQIGLSAIASVVPGGMIAGEGPGLLDLGDLGMGVPLICYEVIFANEVNVDQRGSFLLQITNDAWFGEWSGPYQHLVQARMRAIEQGLPMIRVANTGVSAMIDPYGRVLVKLPLGEAGYADAALPAPLGETLYSKTGDYPAILVICLLLLGLLAASGLANRTNKH